MFPLPATFAARLFRTFGTFRAFRAFRALAPRFVAIFWLNALASLVANEAFFADAAARGAEGGGITIGRNRPAAGRLAGARHNATRVGPFFVPVAVLV